MVKKEFLPVLEGFILDEDCSLTLAQICRVCSVHDEYILELVDEGILEPTGSTVEHFRFSDDSVRRAKMALRLQHDLGINLAGVALVLDLIDEIALLRNRVWFTEME
jgi:chaperone modulatory protein CbpM